MLHQTIQLKNLSLSFPHKVCFEDFSAQVLPASRIAIIGRNGSGKSSLLKMIFAQLTEVLAGYVPQLLDDHKNLSGGARFNHALSRALQIHPDVLLLDEPTNHLDRNNRRSLMRLLQHFAGTLFIVSHDVELLRNCVDTFWHIEAGKVHIFHGNYDDYFTRRQLEQSLLHNEKARLDKEKKLMHEALMQEQIRAAKSQQKGAKSIAQRKWPTVVSQAKASRASQTAGHKRAEISAKKSELNDQLSALHLAEKIEAKFSLAAENMGDRTLLTIRDASLRYLDADFCLTIPSFSIGSKDRIAILGANASGKSTLLKAILGDESLVKEGDWLLPKKEHIGYLDQHYSTLRQQQTVLTTIQSIVPAWTHAEMRKHLNGFLFRKNEEVNAEVAVLSGGEKVRLSLAQIAAKTPRLLILDEVTNNVDLETREHLIQVLRDYPAAMLVVSHDEDFLTEINIHDFWEIKNNQLQRR